MEAGIHVSWNMLWIEMKTGSMSHGFPNSGTYDINANLLIDDELWLTIFDYSKNDQFGSTRAKKKV